MSDDELLDELERNRVYAARLGYLIFAQLMEKAAARIREQRTLLDECERAFQEIINSGGSRGSVAHAEFVDALSIRVLHKLRAQEKTDE